MNKPLWKNTNFASFLYRCFYGQKRLVFYIERHQTLFLGEMYLKGKEKKIQIFDENHGLTTFKKCKF